MCERLEALKCNLSPLNKALIVAFATSLIYDVRNGSKLKKLNKATNQQLDVTWQSRNHNPKIWSHKTDFPQQTPYDIFCIVKFGFFFIFDWVDVNCLISLMLLFSEVVSPWAKSFSFQKSKQNRQFNLAMKYPRLVRSPRLLFFLLIYI